MLASTIIKVFSITILYPLLLTAYDEYNLSKGALNKITQMNEMSDFHYISNMQEQYRFDGYDLAKYYELYYQNIGQEVDYGPVMQSYIEGYQALNNQGGIYFKPSSQIVEQGYSSENEIPLYEVNYNYTMLHPILDEFNQEIEFEKNSNQVYLLTGDQSLDTTNINLPTTVNEVEVLYCSNIKDLPILSLQYYNDHTPIFIVTMDQVIPIDRSPLNYMFYKGEITNQAGDYFTNKIEVEKLNNELKREEAIYSKMNHSSIFIFIVVLTIIILTIIQYASQYFEVQRQKLAVKKLHGYRFYDIFYDLFIEEVMIYGLLIVILNYFKFNVLYAFILMIIDLFILLCVSVWLNKLTLVDNLNRGD